MKTSKRRSSLDQQFKDMTKNHATLLSLKPGDYLFDLPELCVFLSSRMESLNYCSIASLSLPVSSNKGYIGFKKADVDLWLLEIEGQGLRDRLGELDVESESIRTRPYRFSILNLYHRKKI